MWTILRIFMWSVAAGVAAAIGFAFGVLLGFWCGY